MRTTLPQLKQPTSSFWPVFSSVSSVGEYLSFGNHIICPLHVSRINAILGCKRHFHRRMKNNSGQECRLLRRHTRDRLWSATAPQGDRRLVEVSSRTSLCLRKMNSEAMARQSLISNASPAERRDMPTHTSSPAIFEVVVGDLFKTVQRILSLQRSSDQNVEPSWLWPPH
jgi:hypothetical protein